MSVENISNLNKIFTPAYTIIAKVYDEMMTHVNYKRWAKYIRSILKNEKFRDGNLLDIGCGSGEFLKYMQKYNYYTTGCDRSVEMIDRAKKKLPNIHFLHSALPLLEEIPENKYNIIVCLFDIVNYLPDEETLTNSLQNIYRKIKSPGIFIFDVVTKFYCEQFFQNYHEDEILEKDTAYSRVSEFNADQNIQINYIRVYTPDGIFEEIHHQKIFDLQLIQNIILRKTKFEFINMLEDFSFQQADSNSGRVHFVLKKN